MMCLISSGETRKYKEKETRKAYELMKNSETLVVADSCCDIPKNIAESLNIRILPVHILYPDKDYLDGVDIDPAIVYERGPEEIPRTSMPSLGEASDFFEQILKDGYKNVIAVSISDKLSGTGNVIRQAAESVQGLRSFVYNTKNISIASGVFAIWAARKLNEGLSFEEIVKKMPEKQLNSHVMFYMDTLEYLKKGGRIGNVLFLIANVLHLKPIISCGEDGVYYTVAKIRGARRGKEKLLREIVAKGTGRNCWAVVMHGGAKEEGDRLRKLAQEALPQAEFLFDNRQITASLAVHTGPGLVGIMVFTDP